jgi:hypothetical protein
VTTTRSCSWCHTGNAILCGVKNLCRSCGHRADRPRTDCDCPRCAPVRQIGPEDVGLGQLAEAEDDDSGVDLWAGLTEPEKVQAREALRRLQQGHMSNDAAFLHVYERQQGGCCDGKEAD